MKKKKKTKGKAGRQQKKPARKATTNKKRNLIIAIICLVCIFIAGYIGYIITQADKITTYVHEDITFMSMINDRATGMTATGVCYKPDSAIEDCTWVTAGHYFGPTLKTGGYLKRENLYVAKIKYLGNDLATFRWETQPEVTRVITSWVLGELNDYQVNMIQFEKPRKALYLPDQKEYRFIGQFEFISQTGEKSEGFVIERKSKEGDCGKGFLIDDLLCIITKASTDKITYQGGKVEATFCGPVDIK